jgi:hypothetical protein
LVGQFSGIAKSGIKTAIMRVILQAKAIPDQAAFAARGAAQLCGTGICKATCAVSPPGSTLQVR